MTSPRRGFASDNWSGAHPEVLAAIAAASDGSHVPAYGYDPFTERAVARFRELFGDVEVFFVFNGTGANCSGLRACTPPWGGVVCPETAHINTDECGAPEYIVGAKMLPVATPDGKLTPGLVAPRLVHFDEEHHNRPAVVSITQATEFGTAYTPAEVRALADQAHEHGMRLHMDGARLANAAAFLDVPVREFTADAGLDVLSFGGTKNGAVLAEAVVFFDRELARDFKFVRKQSGQLSSKTRFIAAQFEALLTDDLWLRSARHSNAMAGRLAEGLAALGLTVTQAVQANEVFAVLPPHAIEPLQAAFPFYVWNETASEVRLVASFDTTAEDVEGFLAELARLIG